LFLDIPVGAIPYRFSFKVIPLEFEVRSQALIASAETGRKMNLTGELLTSDRVMPDDVKRMLKASFQNKPLTIDWQFDQSGKRNKFTIRDINRETFASDVTLSWDGSPIGIDKQGKQEISVPVLNQFELIDVAVIHDQGTNPYVKINFSDPLDSGINFKGLVQIADEPKDSYKVVAEGNLIKVFPSEVLAGSYNILINPGMINGIVTPSMLLI